MESWLGLLKHLRTAAGSVPSWFWSLVVNTSELQWICMLKHLIELNGFITLLPMRKMLIIELRCLGVAEPSSSCCDHHKLPCANTLHLSKICHPMGYRYELCQRPPVHFGLLGLNSSGTTRVYIGMYFGLHSIAVWLEIHLRPTRLYLAPALP